MSDYFENLGKNISKETGL